MKKILLGVTGGIAAYKAATVVSALKQAGYDVQVAMTPAACKFVTPLTFAALSQKEVRTELFPNNPTSEKGQLYPHLYPATEADALVVVPATADAIAKLAHGFGDDLVCCSALSVKPDCKRIFCPAMNTQMWEQPIVHENCRKLLNLGWHQIGPEKGALACGTSGYGRMSGPSSITQIILNSIF